MAGFFPNRRADAHETVRMRKRILIASIERGALSDPGFEKRAVLDMSTMGGRPCWVVLREPWDTNSVFGSSRKVRAIKLTPDDLHGFARRVDQLAREALVSRERWGWG